MSNYMDFDVSIFVITNENEYVYAPEYDRNYDGDGVFVCLTNDRLKPDYGDNNSICIYKDLKNETGVTLYQWQITQKPTSNNDKHVITKHIFGGDYNEKFSEVMKHLDGYRACQDIMNNVTPLLKNEQTNWVFRKYDYIPAIMGAYCTKIRHNGKIYSGYVPAIGQMLYVSYNILKVIDTLNKMGMQRYRNPQFKVNSDGDGLQGQWWSSTECYNYGHSFGFYMNDGELDHCDKNERMKVLTLFAL